jgi:hypothetical protein
MRYLIGTIAVLLLTGAIRPAAQIGRGDGAQAAARMTAEQLDAAMKTINSANTTLGTKLMTADLVAPRRMRRRSHRPSPMSSGSGRRPASPRR